MDSVVTVVHNHWITLSDGVRLACRLWLPFGVDQVRNLYPDEEDIQQLCDGQGTTDRVPTILEIIPYFKDIYTLERDFARHTLFAKMGYSVCRAEMRGTGNSDGFYYDEYTEQEMRDTEEVLAHLGTSPWSNAKVAMYGKSWSGFNGVQMSARNPEFLTTVVTAYSTDDRFNNDVHYLGGCVVGDGMVNWSTIMHCWNSRPPNPKYCPDWKAKWLERLENTSEPWLVKWLSQQDGQSAYWKHGSVLYAYDKVKIPMLVIGGLLDGYTDGAFRMISRLGPESRGVIGPWGHGWPDVSLPGPNMDFIGMCDKWFSFHMKGNSAVRMDLWPRFQVYVRENFQPATWMNFQNGKWVALDKFSDKTDVGLTLFLGVTRRLIKKPSDRDENPLVLKPHFMQGLFCGQWMSWGEGEGLPGDQRIANGLSECWKSERLRNEASICGYIRLTGKVKGSGCLVARLSCENEDGSATPISYGVQAFKHTEEWGAVEIQFKPTTFKLDVGNRMILALSSSYFPLIVPPTLAGSVTVDISAVQLFLPTLKDVSGLPLNLGQPNHDLFQIKKISHSEDKVHETASVDLYTNECTQVKTVAGAVTEFPDFGLRFSNDALDRFCATTDMTKASVTAERSTRVSLNGANARIDATATMTHGESKFDLEQGLKVFVDDELFFERSWKDKVDNKLLEYV